jgi:hypothetical protein
MVRGTGTMMPAALLRREISVAYPAVVLAPWPFTPAYCGTWPSAVCCSG